MGTAKKGNTGAKVKRKAEAAQVALRVEEVLRIRLDGAQLHDVVHYAAEKGWAVQERQLRNYIHRADDLLVERQEKSRKRLLARHVAQRDALFARAVNAADLRTALAVADSTAKLQGLFADARDLKELARLAASQGERIRELETRLDDARRHPDPTPQPGPEAGPAASGDDRGVA
jgi:hypothetical protein